MARKQRIARSITEALLDTRNEKARRSLLRRIKKYLKALVTLYDTELKQFAPDLFLQLRQEFEIDSVTYVASFECPDDERSALQSKGHMGYSGSTFFTTADGKYLVKSIPRHFENTFFRDDLLRPYINHMGENSFSLLIRITDFLAVEDAYKLSPGILFGLAPSHHIVMENLLVGREEGEQRARKIYNEMCHTSRDQAHVVSDNDEEREETSQPWKWETWDLKPTTYFFPERDIAQGKLSSEATKSRLADEFNDKLYLTTAQVEDFRNQLKRDTQLLEASNAVDYSLFLVRIPIPPIEDTSDEGIAGQNPFQDSSNPETSTTAGPDLAVSAPTPSKPPFAPPGPPSWRTGIRSADGRYIYRAAVLDFFWAKHKVHAKMMTHLVNIWNKVDLGGDKGPMSITTSSSEYRARFSKMCEGLIEILEAGSDPNSS